MLIYYDLKNGLTTPLSETQLADLKKAKVKQTSDYVRIIPGVNELHSKVWAAISTLPKVKRLVQTKSVKVLSEKDATKTKNVIAQIENEDAAIEVIGKTFDHKLLKRWKNGENRGDVLTAIDEQVEFIITATTPKKDEDAA